MVSICIKENNQELQNYIVNEIKESKINDICFSRHCFKVYQNIIIHYKGNDLETFFNFLSKTVSNAIILFYEEKKVKMEL